MELTSGFKDLHLIDQCIQHDLTLYIETYNKTQQMIIPRAMYYLKDKLCIFFEDPKNEVFDFIPIDEIKKFEKHPLKFNLKFHKTQARKMISAIFSKESNRKRVVVKLNKNISVKSLDPDLLYFEEESLVEGTHGMIWSANVEVGSSLMSWLAIQHIKYDLEIISPVSLKEDFQHFIEITLVRAA